MDDYFVIWHSPDGGWEIKKMTERDLITDLSERYWGQVGFVDEIGRAPKEIEGNKLIIIKGKIVVPEPEEVAITYRLPEELDPL